MKNLRVGKYFICCFVEFDKESALCLFSLNDTRSIAFSTHHLSLGSDFAQSYSFSSEDATTLPNHPPHHVGLQK